jgi:hypothetical protein
MSTGSHTSGLTDLNTIIKTMHPALQEGVYIFSTLPGRQTIEPDHCLMMFKEQEGYTFILKKEIADRYGMPYSQIFSWITLTVHSSLESVGLTAYFSKALAAGNISCNVVSGFYHDHIFVPVKDTARAIDILNRLPSSLHQLST